MILLAEDKKLPQNRIAELRKKKNLSQAQLAKETGLTRQAISLYETNRREPKLETWLKLAKFFGVSVSYLQGISSNSEPLFTSDSSLSELKETIDFFNSQVKGEKSLSPKDLVDEIKKLPVEQRVIMAGNFSMFLYCMDFLMNNDEYQIISSLNNLFGVILSTQYLETNSQDIQDKIEDYINEAIFKINDIRKK